MIAMRTVPVVADEADSVIGKPLGKSKPLPLAILQASIGSRPAMSGVGGAVGVGVGEGVGVGATDKPDEEHTRGDEANEAGQS